MTDNGSDIEWHGEAIFKALENKLFDNAGRAGMFLQKSVTDSISRMQPKKRIGGVMRGLEPSEEGEPPKMITGTLRASIMFSREKNNGQISIWVGIAKQSNAEKYAKRLEFGFVGTDARGVHIHQGPRPFLRPAIANNVAEITKIIMSGKSSKKG